MTGDVAKPMPVRARCCSPKTWYWLQRGDVLVGHAGAQANGWWRIYHVDGETRIHGSGIHKSPKEAAAWAQANGLGLDPAPAEDASPGP